MKLLKTAVLVAFGLASVTSFADLRVRENVRNCGMDRACVDRVVVEALDHLDDMVEKGVRERVQTLENRVAELERRNGGGWGGDHDGWGHHGHWGHDSIDSDK